MALDPDFGTYGYGPYGAGLYGRGGGSGRRTGRSCA